MLRPELRDLAKRIYETGAIRVSFPPDGQGFKLHIHQVKPSLREAPAYIETDAIPDELVDEIAAFQVPELERNNVDLDATIEVVPVPNAAIRFAKALAKKLGKELIILDKQDLVKKWQLRRDEILKLNKPWLPIEFRNPKALIVENMVTSGDSIMMTAATAILPGRRVTDVCSAFCWPGIAADRLKNPPFFMNVITLFPLPDLFKFYESAKIGEEPPRAYLLVEDYSRYLQRALL